MPGTGWRPRSLGLREAAERVKAPELVAKRMHRLVVQHRGHRRVHPAGTDTVHTNARSGVVDRHGLGHHDHPALRGIVGDLATETHEPLDAGHEDDAPRPLLEHRREHVLRDDERALQVDVDDALELRDRKQVRRPHADDTRRVHENVDAPEALDGGGHRRPDRLLVADVGLLEDRARRAGTDLSPVFVRRLADVDAGDGGPLGRESPRRGQADAGRHSRDERYPSLQTIHDCSGVVESTLIGEARHLLCVGRNRLTAG